MTRLSLKATEPGLGAAAVQQAELAARVCAQCLFTAGGKDPAGIKCHSPHSAPQERKGSVTFNLPRCALLGLGTPCNKQREGEEAWRRRQKQPRLQPRCSLARAVVWAQGDGWAALQGERGGDEFTWIPFEQNWGSELQWGPLRWDCALLVSQGKLQNPGTHRHSCSLSLLFWVLETVPSRATIWNAVSALSSLTWERWNCRWYWSK